MKRSTWPLMIGVAVVGLAGLRLWLELRERADAAAMDIPPPVPPGSITPLQQQLPYPRGSTVELWGEVVSSRTDLRFYVGAFRALPRELLAEPDIQRGVLDKPGYFRMSLPKNAGKVYLLGMADKTLEGPSTAAIRTAWKENPIEVRDRNIGGIRLEFPAR